jgi:quinol monooxygenase YgiN
MTTIAKDNKVVTFINVFTTAPADQREVLAILDRVTSTIVRHAPGFVSSSLHRSVDGTKVVMYAQWRSIEEYEAMRANPEPTPFLQQAMKLATFAPGMYEVTEIYAP